MAKAITAVLIGAGNRGAESYAPYALQHPDELRFVAVAEPHPGRRARFARDHSIPREQQFVTWQDLLERGKIADAALICTPDQMHVAPTLAALDLGYDVLLEKPMATTLRENVQLVQAADRTGRLLQVCHVLRYTPFFEAVHDIVASGRLGDIITVEHRENVTYWHMAHSFVRGNWRNSQLSSPMILAKCCHDLDILYWNLGPCRRLNSFGSLLHYRAENAPEGAPERCTDGCPAADECPWYAPRIYIDLTPLRQNTPDQEFPDDYAGWPRSVISEDTTREGLQRALETGPYGRCVYHCDNDAVDNQIVNLEMESGPSVALFMHGHSHREGRSMRYDGTRATLRGIYFFDEQRIEIHDHLTSEVEVVEPQVGPFGGTGHGGGDYGLMNSFARVVRDPDAALTDARESLESHLMAFAAEQARLEGTIVEMGAFRQQAETLTGE
jgi:predicted dehydrogenase